MKQIILNILDILFHLLPVCSKRVFFTSFYGQYNDNPKYVSECLHILDPSIKLYWGISPKSKLNDIPDYVQIVNFDTIRYKYLKNRCKVIVENGAGATLLYCSNRYLFKIKQLLKNKKQYDIATWHGNPIKHIGAQIPGNEDWSKNTVFSTADVLLAGCEQVKTIFEEAFLDLMPVSLLGTPRTDLLFKTSKTYCNYIKSKLQLPEDKRIVLYAPTYRNNNADSGIEQLKMMNLNRLLNTLHSKFGGDWVFVMRVHNMVLLEIENSGILNQYMDCIINGNLHDDMNEYLFVADVLISDYSGCVYDVALTDKPCFLFAHDRGNYENNERGFYTQLSEFPYPFCDSFESLITNIENYNFESSSILRNSFLKKIGNIEDGNASLRVSQLVLDKLSNI